MKLKKTAALLVPLIVISLMSSLNAAFEYGASDREPPVLSIIPDYTYISPNYD